MNLGDSFPTTANAFPELLPWDLPFGWIGQGFSLANLVFDVQIKFQESDGQLRALCGALRADVVGETERVTDPNEAAMIDGFRFVVAQVPIHQTMSAGRLGDCYHWLLWSISRTHVFGRMENHAEYRLPPFPGASAEMNELASDVAVDWVYAAFIVAHKFGGLDGHCKDFFDACFYIALEAVKTAGSKGIGALTAIIAYTAPRKFEATKALADILLDLLQQPETPVSEKVQIQIVMTTQAGFYTHTHPVEWARRTLRDYRSELRSHETVQLLAVTIDSENAWRDARSDVLAEVRGLADSYRAHYSRSEARISLDSRILVLHPIIYSLCKFGSTDDLMAVLFSWYGEPDTTCADGNILFVSPNHSDGVAYVWPGGRHFASGAVVDTLEETLTANSVALNEYFRGPKGDRFIKVDERLKSTPAFEHGADIWKAMEDHYRLSEVAAHLPQGWMPRSVVVMPAHRDPFQAMLSEQLGWNAPLEVSLSAPDAMRPIRTVSIWPGATHTTEAEVEVIGHVAAIARWDLRIVTGTLDQHAFQRFYEDPEADLLWVIGHGEQSADDLEKTGVLMHDDSLVSLVDITKFKVPSHGRRLLVLNICSSATAQTLNGMARSGLAQELVSPQQQIIAHLWPIDYYAALAFGSSLALTLGGRSAASALQEASQLMRNQTGLLEKLTEISPELQAIHRLQGERVAIVLESVLSWGCPIILT
ncbi:CHAT domain-containing protein [Mesorhizobium sp. M0437]|uniref:CHAT domain-containing protein n=1 Tax=Mesorhizobium sp. M0437 TaxID=2956945 RepID=UPI0033361C13